jgi:periplasmic divalent cation tolerance protein
MLKLLYVTCPDMEVAKIIARYLLSERVIACANMWAGMSSMYHWQGSIEESSEVVLLCKTTPELVEETKQAIIALHPYECACVLVVDVSDGHQNFIDWVKKEVQKD